MMIGLPNFASIEVLHQTAFVGVIIASWAELTLFTYEMVRQILTSSEEVTWKSVTKVMCEECKEYFSDDVDELVHGKFLCESCRDDINCVYLEK